MLILVDANPKDTTSAASDSSPDVATDPSVPPSNGTCHLMRLPPELRLAIAERIFEDFFTRLTLGLYPPFSMNGESQLPYTQELFSVLHVNRAFRLESIDLCTRLAIHSAGKIVSHPPTNARQSSRIGPHRQLKLEHRKILGILQGAKMSAVDAEPGITIPNDLSKAL